MGSYHKVAVLLGGVSAEREVSLSSGKAVAQALRQTGYEVQEVDVTGRCVELPQGTDAVFNVLHGHFGEDGEVQAILRAAQMPYTGASVEASALAFNKLAAKQLWESRGLPTPAYEVVRPGVQLSLSLPVVVKPVRQGSSVGIHLVFDEHELAAALTDAARHDDQVLIESYIAGRELTVGIVEGRPLPVLEICAPNGNYDYRAKYTAGLTEYRVPAPIPAAQAEACQALALAAFECLGCDDMGRVDFRMNSAGELFILELNTIPGFTATSLLPKAAAAAGMDFPTLCDRIIRGARVK